MSVQIIPIVGFKIAKSIHLEQLKKDYKGEIVSSSPFEVFIKLSEFSFINLQQSGEISCSDCDESTISKFIDFTSGYIEHHLSATYIFKEDFSIEFNSESLLFFKYNSVIIPELIPEVIQLILLNINQSVSLDYFTKVTSEIHQKTTILSKELEIRGRLKISKSNLMRFIGTILNTQNQFVETIYYNDEPDSVWEDEYLSQLNEGLSKTFKLKKRFEEVDYKLNIIDLNLKVFAQLVQHRENHKMEWVIIVLIFFELLNIIIGKHN